MSANARFVIPWDIWNIQVVFIGALRILCIDIAYKF